MSTIRRSIIAGALALPMSLGTVGVAAAADGQDDVVAPNDGGVSVSIQADGGGDDPEASGEGHAWTENEDDDALLDLGDDNENEHHEHNEHNEHDEDGLLGILG